MTACHLQASGAVESYFYGELAGAEGEAFVRHTAVCAECRHALEELNVIRAALESRPDVAAPPGDDWSGFMVRLGNAVRAETAGPSITARNGRMGFTRSPLLASLAAAAVLALVTVAVLVLMRTQPSRSDLASGRNRLASVSPHRATSPASLTLDPALASVTEQHFTRSKLVVLGLATKDPAEGNAADWEYERALATSLLDDTRLYRQTAEERGMKGLADVMRDLEIVLLQTSMSAEPDAESLAQLQNLIRRRDLIAKMDVVATSGLLP